MENRVSIATTVDEVVLAANATKEQYLHCSGGLRLQYQYLATIDLQNNFAFAGPATVEEVLRWPKFLVRASGVYRDDHDTMNRISVYDFIDHQTLAINLQNKHVHIVPERHMFSSGFSLYHKMLQWSEGYQIFRLGESSIDFTIPECFTHAEYRHLGEVELDGVRCLQLSSPDDDIWLSVDHGCFIKRRETRYSNTPLLKSRIEVLEYREAKGAKGFKIPWVIHKTEFAEPQPESPGIEEILSQFELRVLNAKFNNVKDEELNIEMLPDAHVDDLIADKRYYNNR